MGEHEEDLEVRAMRLEEIEVTELGEEKDESHGPRACVNYQETTSLL